MSWSEDPSFKAWAKHVIEETAPAMRGSSTAIALVTGEGDVQQWVEIGAMVMMDKPICVVVVADAVVSEKLLAVADEVVRLPEGVTPEASEELAAALHRMAG